MQTYLRKNVLTVIILAVTVILTGLAVFTAIRLYQLRDQAVAPNAPSSKPAAQEASPGPTFTRTQTVVLPKFTSAACPWNQADNLGKNEGNARARIAKTSNFDLLDCDLTSGSVNSLVVPPTYLYDDTLLITMDNKVLAGTNTIVSPLGGIGSAFDWAKVKNTDQDSQKPGTKIVCIGETCEAPYTYKHESGAKTPLVNISLSKQNLATLLNAGLTNHTFGAVVIGDGDVDTDCKLQEDLVLTLNYTCQTQIASCQEVTFNINTPTPTPTAPPVSCNNSCNAESDCGGNNDCIGNVCRNPQCDTETDCTCNGSSPTPTPTATPTASPTATPVSCNNSCSANTDCSGGLVCNGGMCRNTSCTSETDCTCAVVSPTPTGTAAPELPNAGISAPTLIGGAAGILLLLGALLLAL